MRIKTDRKRTGQLYRQKNRKRTGKGEKEWKL